MASRNWRDVTMRVPAQAAGKCFVFPVTKEWAAAAWAHSRKTSSSGSEQARTRSTGLTQSPRSRMVRSVASISPSLRLKHEPAELLLHTPRRCRRSRRAASPDQGGSSEISARAGPCELSSAEIRTLVLENNPDHCSTGCWRLRRAWRAASISASISSVES